MKAIMVLSKALTFVKYVLQEGITQEKDNKNACFARMASIQAWVQLRAPNVQQELILRLMEQDTI